jgi:hypothetical protein
MPSVLQTLRAGLTPLLLAACVGEGTGPTALATPHASVQGTPTFLQLAPDAPPLVSASVSFWAVEGQDREAAIFYQRPDGGTPTNSDRLARLRVRKHSLVTAADGTALAPGDSVLITMTVVDPDHQVIEFQPAGLHFDPSEPARLSIWYRQANHDFNLDGVIDGADAAIETRFAIWRQEQPGDPWTSLVTALVPGLDQTSTEVPGFTRFAVAY